MTLEEMFDQVLIQSGQFLIDKSVIELDQDRFLVPVRQTLGFYNKYSPRVVNLYKSIESSKQFTFTEENTEGGAPDYISTIIPSRISGVMPFFLRRDRLINPAIENKQEFPFQYRKPVLTVPVEAEYDIKAVYKHKVTSQQISNKTVYSVDTITEEDETFFDLLTSHFMKILATSRRAFTLQDLPIVSDASELISDAKELQEKAERELIDNEHKFYLAWR